MWNQNRYYHNGQSRKKENITSQWDFQLKQSKLIEVRENKWGQARLVKFPHLIGLSDNKSLFTN